MGRNIKNLDIAWQPERYPRTRKWIVRLFRVIFNGLYRIRAEGLDNLPENDAYILAGNHQSMRDLFFVHPFVPRNVNWLAKQELFTIPIIGEIVRRFGAIPVDREHTDVRSVKVVFSVLRAGGVVGVFPEATRLKPEMQGKVLPRRQVLELIIRTGVPIVPFAIPSPIRIFRENKVIFGKAFRFPEHVTGKRMPPQEVALQGRFLMRKIYDLISVPVSNVLGESGADGEGL